MIVDLILLKNRNFARTNIILLKKGMEHFPRKKIKLPYESIMRATYGLPTKDGNT